MIRRSLHLATSAVVCLMACILTGSGCSQSAYSFEQPMALGPAPVSVSIEQISSEYKNDPAAADARYLDKILSFGQVTVENVHTYYYSVGAGQPWSLQVEYFTSGNVAFQLLDFKGAQQNVQAGYILILEGMCKGLVKDGHVLVTDCWYKSIQGDIGTVITRAGSY